MSLLKTITAGLRSLFLRQQVGRDLDEELSGFLEMATEEKMRRGMSRKDTLREVRLERGSLEIAKEVVSAAGWESILETLWQDLHFAVRQWTKNPGLALTAVLILAMGMAVSVPIFGFVDAALSRVIVHSVHLGPTQPKFLVL